MTNASAFGRSVASAGDLDGYGWLALFVGNPTHDTASTNEGAVITVIFDGPDSIMGSSVIAPRDALPPGTETFSHFGQALAFLGDLNGVGALELAVSSRDKALGGLVATSEVWTVNVDANGAATNFHPIEPARDSLKVDVPSSSDFGSALSAIWTGTASET